MHAMFNMIYSYYRAMSSTKKNSAKFPDLVHLIRIVENKIYTFDIIYVYVIYGLKYNTTTVLSSSLYLVHVKWTTKLFKMHRVYVLNYASCIQN